MAVQKERYIIPSNAKTSLEIAGKKPADFIQGILFGIAGGVLTLQIPFVPKYKYAAAAGVAVLLFLFFSSRKGGRSRLGSWIAHLRFIMTKKKYYYGSITEVYEQVSQNRNQGSSSDEIAIYRNKLDVAKAKARQFIRQLQKK